MTNQPVTLLTLRCDQDAEVRQRPYFPKHDHPSIPQLRLRLMQIQFSSQPEALNTQMHIQCQSIIICFCVHCHLCYFFHCVYVRSQQCQSATDLIIRWTRWLLTNVTLCGNITSHYQRFCLSQSANTQSGPCLQMAKVQIGVLQSDCQMCVCTNNIIRFSVLPGCKYWIQNIIKVVQYCTENCVENWTKNLSPTMAE